MLGKIIEWVTGNNSIQKDERKPVTRPPIQGLDIAKAKSPTGYPTLYAFWFWIDNVRQFDKDGNEYPRFMDWFRSI